VTKYGLDLSESRVRRDLAKEKAPSFEETETWRRVRALYEEKLSKKAAYARLPDVRLDSIKLAGDKSTAWFAKNVEKRRQSCLERLRRK
jgi:hypothetical protein